MHEDSPDPWPCYIRFWMNWPHSGLRKDRLAPVYDIRYIKGLRTRDSGLRTTLYFHQYMTVSVNTENERYKEFDKVGATHISKKPTDNYGPSRRSPKVHSRCLYSLLFTLSSVSQHFIIPSITLSLYILSTMMLFLRFLLSALGLLG